MADVGAIAAKQLREITECPICTSAFNDPRMLPCIHTFCFQCLKGSAEGAQLNPGDQIPCPLCRKEFTIPKDGMTGVQKNFFMENLLEFKNTLQIGSVEIICDICSASDEDKTGEITKATMRCLECQDNYCDSCLKVHKFHRMSRNHQVVNIGSDITSPMKLPFTVKSCTKHIHKLLDYYCAECKKIVCVSCFVESHKLHECKDVSTAYEEFSKTIENKVWRMSNCADEMMSVRNRIEKRKADFIMEIAAKENEVHEKNQELKNMIDEHTKLLLEELSVIKSNQLKETENEMEEIDRCCTIVRSFEAYCTELILKGSASDICSSVDELIIRADELERDHEAFIGRPHNSVEVSFQAADLREVLQKSSNNLVGQIKETTAQFENYAVVIGMNDGISINRDVVRVNLHCPNDISKLRRLPARMQEAAIATVYCDALYITGIGKNADEIWNYNFLSGWLKCASLVQGRCRYSAAFINEVLYICGGSVKSNERVLDCVEAYNAVADNCITVGKLVHGIESSGNCVPFDDSLYIFGGLDKEDNEVSHVQVYNTKQNTCTLLSKPLPRPYYIMRAALWETSVILLAEDTCFVYNFESETWQEREQFKTGVDYFGLVLENERIFVLGGGEQETDEADEITWECRDDVRYISVRNIIEDKPTDWKIHGKLSTPSLVHACVKMQFPV